MSKKINNKTLLIILILLVGLFLVLRMIRNNRIERSFKTDLVDIDTSRITAILLYPRVEDHAEIRFTRSGNGWSVSKGDITAEAGSNSIQGLLSQLLQIKPISLAARNSEKWEEYQLTDSLATRLKVIESKGKETLDLMVGRFSYQQNNDPYRAYGERGNVTGTTYVRLGNEDEIYAIDGFLTMSINREFNYWRNQVVLNTRKQDITKLVFHYPADSGFIAVTHDTIWMINDVQADSLQMDRYLTSLSYKSHSSFTDNFTPLSNPDYQLTIEGNNMSPVVVQAFIADTSKYIINSSLNPGSWFESDADELFAGIFKTRRYFMEE